MAAITVAIGGGYHGGYGGYRGGYWGHRGGYWGGPGVFWGGLGIGLGVGALAYSAYPYYYGAALTAYYGAAPAYYDDGIDQGAVVVSTQPADDGRSVAVAADRALGQPVPQASRAMTDPIFYPKNGQTAARTETDRQECNRWATSQPNAMNDASIFQRATFACMEGRGYSVR